jgi:pilus assembly protein Flp/PilA
MTIRNWFNRMVARAAGATSREEGQTMVEYGLILALISLAVVAVMVLIGTQLNVKFGEILTKLGGVVPT